MKTESRNYGCSQGELYAIARIAWGKFKNDLADFSSFRGFYKPSLYETRIAEIKTAAALDDFQARDEASESHRIQLLTIANECINCWRSLSRYIEHAYPEELAKPKLEAAGKGYYADAAKSNWKALSSLNISGTNFLAANKADLLANENMPEGFQEQYLGSVKNFETVFDLYIGTGEEISHGTNEKIKANNKIYKDLRSMLDDAQAIYSDNKAKSSEYVFDYLRSIITVPSSGAKSPQDTASDKDVTK